MKLEPLRFGNDLAKIAAAVMLVQAWGLFRAAGKGVDLLAFWAAGRLALEGRAAEAYNLAALRPVEIGSGAELIFPFLNPPPFLALFTPLSLLPYPAALAVFGVATFALYLTGARAVLPRASWLWAVFPPVALNLIIGQNGLLLAGLFLWAMALIDRRPILAGVLIGLMTIKPQLGLLIPIALIGAGRWRVFAAAAISTMILFGASELILPGTFAAFLANAQYSAGLVEQPALMRKLHSVYGAVRLLGAPTAAAAGIQALVSLALAVMIFRVWREARAPLEKAAILAAATPLATPYIFDYDLTLLILPLGLMASARPATFSVLFIAPALSRLLTLTAGFGLGPAISLAILGVNRMDAEARVEKSSL